MHIFVGKHNLTTLSSAKRSSAAHSLLERARPVLPAGLFLLPGERRSAVTVARLHLVAVKRPSRFTSAEKTTPRLPAGATRPIEFFQNAVCLRRLFSERSFLSSSRRATELSAPLPRCLKKHSFRSTGTSRLLFLPDHTSFFRSRTLKDETSPLLLFLSAATSAGDSRKKDA